MLQLHTPEWMSPELEAYRDSVSRIITAEFLPHEPRWAEQQRVDREAWLLAGRHGLLCPGIPEEYGGGGGNFMHEAIAISEQSRLLATGLGNGVHSGIVAHYLLNFASEEQKRRWLPRMASGELIAALAMTEPHAGTDLQSIRTRAVIKGDHYVVNGSKTYISNGQNANLVCLVVKTDPEAGARGISILVIEVEQTTGLRRGRALRKVGLHSSDTSELFFDDMHVPRESLLGGEEGLGFKQVMKELPRERLLAAFTSLACMGRALQETLSFASQRKMFGQSLLDLQNTRFKLAECYSRYRTAAVFADHCAKLLMEDRLDSSTAAMAKYTVSEACGQVVDECLQLHGGAGYMMDYPIATLYQNVRILRILAGTNEIMKELIARDLARQV